MNTSALDPTNIACVALIAAISVWHFSTTVLITQLKSTETVKCEQGLTSLLATLTLIMTGALTANQLLDRLGQHNLSLKPIPDEVSLLRIYRAWLGAALSSASFLIVIEIVLEGQVRLGVVPETVRAAYFWLSIFSFVCSIICSVTTVWLACHSDWRTFRNGVRQHTTGTP